MAFNGSGIFNRLYSWVKDAANGIKIRADRMDNEMNGMATGLTDCVTRDGQSPWLQDLPAGGFKLTGLGDAVSPQDAATLSQTENLINLSINNPNKLFNGDAQIDQEHVGGVFDPTADGNYALDGVQLGLSVTGKYSTQRVSGSSCPFLAQGFNDALLITSLAAYNPGASEQYSIRFPIEGFDVQDLEYGQTGAKSATFSTWFQCSLTGNFTAVLYNATATYSYPVSAVYASANTPQRISLTIPGDAVHALDATNAPALVMRINLGCGATEQAAADAWAAGSFFGTSGVGQVNLVGTLDATMYLTGWKLETGTLETPFTPDPVAVSLLRCQRWYDKTFPQLIAPADFAGFAGAIVGGVRTLPGAFGTSWEPGASWPFKTTLRISTPTIKLYNPNPAGIAPGQWSNSGNTEGANAASRLPGDYGVSLDNSGTVINLATNPPLIHATADARP